MENAIPLAIIVLVLVGPFCYGLIGALLSPQHRAALDRMELAVKIWLSHALRWSVRRLFWAVLIASTIVGILFGIREWIKSSAEQKLKEDTYICEREVAMVPSHQGYYPNRPRLMRLCMEAKGH
jgi:hypothetical protein